MEDLKVVGSCSPVFIDALPTGLGYPFGEDLP